MRISCPSGPEVLDSSQPQKSFSGVSWRGGPRLPLAPQSPPSGDVQRLLGASGGKGSGSLRGPEGDLVGTWRLEPWGQLLQTHSFLLSRDPPPTSPTTSHRGQWCLQPPEMNGAFESRTPGVSGGHRVRGCLASRARFGEEVSCGSRLRDWWLVGRRFILDQAVPGEELFGGGGRERRTPLPVPGRNQCVPSPQEAAQQAAWGQSL